ncbi:MAG: ABC transporter permease [Planctomycetota bacterium]|nr:ABC transporter permease [Planctomycetota bacterium]
MKKELGIFVLLVVLCVVVSIKNPDFLQAVNLQNMARRIGMYGIYSIGLGVVIITSGIDLSVGSVFALQGIVMSIMLENWGWPWYLATPLIVVGVMALGWLHGVMVARVGMQPFIVTLCGLLIYRGVARFISGDRALGIGAGEYGVLKALAQAKPLGVPMPFVILIVVTAVMWVLLHRSVYGRYLFAVGKNEDAARFSGINTRRVIASAYVLCMALTAISGIIFVFDTGSIQGSNFGNFYELYGIAAAVLGGCSLRGGEGSVIGIVIGTALLQVLQNLVNLLGIDSSLNFAVMGTVIFVGVLADQILTQRRAAKQSVAH